jgi:CO/xanthine dehydrogenase FAD-binding subunit
VEILGDGGFRWIKAEALFNGSALKPLTLTPAEIISSVVVPQSGTGFGWGYHKSTIRGGLEFAMANIAIALRLENDNKTCAAAQIVVGAVSGGPLRALATEQALVGQVLDEESLSRAADVASNEINPLPHHGFTRNYLKENIRVYLRRTLGVALARARGEQV